MFGDENKELLKIAISAAVPLWIETLKGSSWDYIQTRARECSQMIAEHGDNILFKSKKKGESAHAFNHLAEGLACCAFVPGGVKFMGMRFEAKLDETV